MKKILMAFMLVGLMTSCTKEVEVEVPVVNPVNQANLAKIDELQTQLNSVNTSRGDLSDQLIYVQDQLNSLQDQVLFTALENSEFQTEIRSLEEKLELMLIMLRPEEAYKVYAIFEGWEVTYNSGHQINWQNTSRKSRGIHHNLTVSMDFSIFEVTTISGGFIDRDTGNSTTALVYGSWSCHGTKSKTIEKAFDDAMYVIDQQSAINRQCPN